MTSSARYSGFTLVEMVMTIVLLGIIAGVLVPVITQSTSAYMDTSARSELTARGRLALERLAKEIRRVVPNTVQTLAGGTGVEFVTSKVGGRYMSRSDPFAPGVYQNNRRFRKNANLSALYILGTAYTNPLASDVLVIYNESPATLATRSIGLDGTAPSSDPDGDGTNEVQLLTFDAGRQWNVEPQMQHYQVADFCHELGQSGQTLYWRRATNVTCIDGNPPVWAATDPILVRTDTLVATFNYIPTSLTSNGILHVTLTLTEQGETVTMSQEMHVRNTP
jgi:MSHA biogenesis protein MshO